MQTQKNFLIYSASAGSGKTFTLVGNYLEKILEPTGSFRNVLAITFTNKATAEMKLRIIRELDNLASGKPSIHLSPLTEKLSLDENIIRRNAATQLQRILHDFSSFAVTTIDSYFQELTRTLTRELKIPVKFDIELNTDRIRHEIAGRILSKAGYDADLTSWLNELLLRKLEDGKGWKIQPDLRAMTGEVIYSEPARSLANSADRKTIKKLLDELLHIKLNLEKSLSEIGHSALNSIQKSGFTIKDFKYGAAGPVAYFSKLTEKESKKWKPGVRVTDALDDATQLFINNKSTNENLRTLCIETLHPLLDQAVDLYRSNIYAYNSSTAALRYLYYAGITPVIADELKTFRDEQHVYLLSDTTRLLMESIGENDAPFIYEKSGARFRHLFIDEFQDTSTEQWRILLPLARNTLGGGNRLLLVGDAKQSIYRWRGGNMHLIRKDAAADLREFALQLQHRNLDTNWRSASEIVHFNNIFFPLLANVTSAEFPQYTDPELKAAYDESLVKQKIIPAKEGKGYIEFTFFESAKGKNKNQEDEQEDESHWKEKALVKLKQTLDKCVNAGYELRDISILFRRNKEEKEIATYLLENTIHPFISTNSLKLHNNAKVRFILNCIYMIAGRDEALHRSEAEEFLLLHKLTPERTEKIPYRKISGFEEDSWFKTKLEQLIQQSASLPVSLLIAMIREKSGLTEADPFLDAFEDIIHEYSLKSNGGNSEFISWWEDQLETKEFCLEIPDTLNAIRMLSVHGSKGLEFPVVIIPFLDWKILPDFKTKIWAKSETPPYHELDRFLVAATQTLEDSAFAADYQRECREAIIDNLNLTYVAFTRPKERLYAFGSLSPKHDYAGKYIIQAIKSSEYLNGHVLADREVFTAGKTENAVLSSATAKENSLYHPENTSSAKAAMYQPLQAPVLAAGISTPEINMGNAIHEIIALTHSMKDVEMHVQKAALKYAIPFKDLELSVKKLMDLLQQSGWLASDWKVFTEADFCDGQGNVFRPDRILSRPDETVVLDFKTGQPSKAYQVQVQNYCNLLRDTGFPNVSGYLLYPAAGIIEPV